MHGAGEALPQEPTRPLLQHFDRLALESQTDAAEIASNLLGMASERAEPGLLDRASASSELGEGWRSLTKRATAIALITSPAPFVWFHSVLGWSLGWSLAGTFLV